MSERKHIKLIRESDYVAEVEVTLLESPDAWAPHLSLEDAEKLDQVRLALRRRDLAVARQHGRVYRLTPVTAD
ncbi:MAG: hypothetical protein ISS72_08845 [Candidatus Brocadiae bacterium]|nr:hypothetical protein [Candidatus Brocadiia bacterium]